MKVSSVQFSHSGMSNSLPPHESQHARPPCPSPTPGVYSNSCPSSWRCHPAISSSVVPFLSCPNPSQYQGLFQWVNSLHEVTKVLGVSVSGSILPMNTQDWSLGWTGWISLQSKGLSRVFSNTTVQKHQFFSTQLSSHSNIHIHMWPLEKPYPWLDGPERLLLNDKTLGFLASGGDEFNLGPEMRLDRSELLCNKVLLKYKGDRENFWHRHQKVAERVPSF